MKEYDAANSVGACDLGHVVNRSPRSRRVIHSDKKSPGSHGLVFMSFDSEHEDSKHHAMVARPDGHDAEVSACESGGACDWRPEPGRRPRYRFAPVCSQRWTATHSTSIWGKSLGGA